MSKISNFGDWLRGKGKANADRQEQEFKPDLSFLGGPPEPLSPDEEVPFDIKKSYFALKAIYGDDVDDNSSYLDLLLRRASAGDAGAQQQINNIIHAEDRFRPPEE